MASPLIMIAIMLYCSGFRAIRLGFASTVEHSYHTPAGGLNQDRCWDMTSRPTDRATPSTPQNC